MNDEIIQAISAVAEKTEATEVSVDLIVQQGFERDAIIAAMKSLAKKHDFQFVVGRKGNPSRLASDTRIIDALNGDKPRTEKITTETFSSPESPTKSISSDIHHLLVVRVDPRFELKLPYDLTEAEADRIKRFLDAIVI